MRLRRSKHLRYLIATSLMLLGTTSALAVTTNTIGIPLTTDTACGCEAAAEEEEEPDGTQEWEVRAETFEAAPPVKKKHSVTIELVKGGPETLTSINVGLPANFTITNRNGCEKKYNAGTSCSIEMEFESAGKGAGTYPANLELSFETIAKLTFTKIPKGII